MHTGPADACAWAHPRWRRAAERVLGALPVFGCGADVVGPHSVQVVKEQALRERSLTRSQSGGSKPEGLTTRPLPALTGPERGVEEEGT